jgi:hypothetical protein
VTNDGDEERVAEVAEACRGGRRRRGHGRQSPTRAAQRSQTRHRRKPKSQREEQRRHPRDGNHPSPHSTHKAGPRGHPPIDSRRPRHGPHCPHIANRRWTHTSQRYPCLEDGTWTDVTYAAGGTKPRGRSDHASVCIGCEVREFTLITV